jgi:hypothetical protein
MKEQGIGSQIWRFFLTVLIVTAVAALLAGTTFLLLHRLGPFSLRAYSDRLFWAGITLIVLGGFAVVASLGSLKTVGTPSVLTAGADARNAQSRIQDHFNVNSKRTGFVMRMLLSGVLCIALSALIEVLTRPQ